MKTTVLIADPHQVFREGLRQILESREDLEIVGEADEGRGCVELTRKLEPDIAILEVWLPHGSGLDVVRRILAMGSSRVVVVTMRERGACVKEALRLGVSGYVFKSEPAEEVIRALSAALLGRTYLSPEVLPYVLEGLGGSAGDGVSSLDRLTSREREVLELIAGGLSSKEIAASLGVSAKTVDSHRARLMQKTGIHKTAGLVRLAFQEGLIAP